MIVNRRALVVALLTASAAPRIALSQTAADPDTAAAIVRALLDAMEANDADRIRSAFGPDATQAYGDGAKKSGEVFSRWLKSDIIDLQGRVSNPQLTANGNEVVVTGRYQNNFGYSSAANFLFKVADGRIVSWQMRY